MDTSSTHITLTYDNLTAGDVEIMDPLTGWFVAPMAGTYLFHAYTLRYSNGFIDLYIRKNGQKMSYGYDMDDKYAEYNTYDEYDE